MHVLVGTNDGDYELVASALAGSRRLANWIVPKRAEIGDGVLIFIHRAGFVARGRVATQPVRGSFGQQAAHVSDITELWLFAKNVPLEHIRAELPEWRWLDQQSKSRTTPKPEIAARLWRVVEACQH